MAEVTEKFARWKIDLDIYYSSMVALYRYVPPRKGLIFTRPGGWERVRGFDSVPEAEKIFEHIKDLPKYLQS